jgi:hypothetical protein
LGPLVRSQLKTITLNFKLCFKYILLKFDFFFVKNKFRNDKVTTLIVTSSTLYYLCLHLKLSSLFYAVQLSDLFSYELPVAKVTALNSMFVYNFHSMLNEHRFFIFVSSEAHLQNSYKTQLTSITELFLNAN